MHMKNLKKFDIQISLEKCPPNYGKGLTWLKRIAVNLDTLIIKDAAGVTLQPRKKNLEEQNTDDLTSSFEAMEFCTTGKLWLSKKEPMVNLSSYLDSTATMFF